MFSLISNKVSFKYNEKFELKFFYNKKNRDVIDFLGESFNLMNFWKDMEVNVKLLDSQGEEVKMPLNIIFENDGSFTVRASELPRNFRPGQYKLFFTIVDNTDEESETIEIEQAFTWGIMAFNTDKSVYLPDETAYLQMAVLDKNGNTVCNAILRLEIEAPNGTLAVLDTDN